MPTCLDRRYPAIILLMTSTIRLDTAPSLSDLVPSSMGPIACLFDRSHRPRREERYFDNWGIVGWRLGPSRALHELHRMVAYATRRYSDICSIHAIASISHKLVHTSDSGFGAP